MKINWGDGRQTPPAATLIVAVTAPISFSWLSIVSLFRAQQCYDENELFNKLSLTMVVLNWLRFRWFCGRVGWGDGVEEEICFQENVLKQGLIFIAYALTLCNLSQFYGAARRWTNCYSFILAVEASADGLWNCSVHKVFLLAIPDSTCWASHDQKNKSASIFLIVAIFPNGWDADDAIYPALISQWTPWFSLPPPIIHRPHRLPKHSMLI